MTHSPDTPSSAPEPDDLTPLDAEDATLDVEAALGIISAQRAAVRDTVEPDTRLLFATWGLAWLVGNLLLFVTARESTMLTPAGWSFAIYYVLLAVAVAVTIVHTVQRSRGVVGPSGRSGAMFGWAWTISFVGVFLTMTGLMEAGASPQVINLGWSALSCLLVGILYLAGGAMWQSTVLYALGGWIVVVAGASTLAGLPGSFLVMALAGGGGLLVGALASHVREYRRA